MTPMPTTFADRVLKGSGIFWYIVALVGQIAFVYFILAHYAAHTLAGNFAGWNDNPIITGHVEGDGLGNFMFITHVLGATVISLGGMLQLFPPLRSRFPLIHRWIGRSFMVMALLMATGGLMMTWARGSRLNTIGAMGISLDGILILIFACVAWRLAVVKNYDAHRRWAMRTFMVANGVWFLRLFIMAWAISTQGAGMNKTMSGPADIVLQFACYLAPLFVLELYFRAQRSASAPMKWSTALVVFLGTLFMAVGIFGAQMFLWTVPS